MRTVAAWYCAMLLWISGTQHVSNPFYFFATILDYQLISAGLAAWVSATLPWMHLMLAGVLVAPGMKFRLPFLATAMLGLLFFVAQLTVWIRGIPADCGCFGGAVDRSVGPVSLAIAASLCIAALLGASGRCQEGESEQEDVMAEGKSS